MSTNMPPELNDIQVDAENLYREETFTDLKVATLRRLVPVRKDGSDDPGRTPLWTAVTQILTPQGALPLQAPIEAQGLEEAIEKFPDAIKVAFERMMDEVRDMQRQESSRIVVPGRDTDPNLFKP